MAAAGAFKDFMDWMSACRQGTAGLVVSQFIRNWAVVLCVATVTHSAVLNVI